MSIIVFPWIFQEKGKEKERKQVDGFSIFLFMFYLISAYTLNFIVLVLRSDSTPTSVIIFNGNI